MIFNDKQGDARFFFVYVTAERSGADNPNKGEPGAWRSLSVIVKMLGKDGAFTGREFYDQNFRRSEPLFCSWIKRPMELAHVVRVLEMFKVLSKTAISRSLQNVRGGVDGRPTRGSAHSQLLAEQIPDC